MSLFTELFEGLDDTDEKTKVCSKCKNSKTISCFGKASGGKYLRSECRECNRKITKERFKARLSAPTIPKNYTCPICLRDEEEVKDIGGKKSGGWCCDHNHKTGEFRGWLCHQCNRAIGQLADDAGRLHRVLEYIKK